MGLFVFNVFGQDQDSNDFNLWSSLRFDYKINKKLKIGVEEQLRLKENSSVIDNYFTEFHLDYELHKYFEISGAYRFTKSHDNKGKIHGYENQYRYNFDATVKHDIGRGDAAFRSRYQNKNDFGEIENSSQQLRYKATYNYNINHWKFDPKLSFELFQVIQSEENSGFQKYRIGTGTSYDIKNLGEIEVYYNFQKGLNTNTSEVTHILGLGYKYTLK